MKRRRLVFGFVALGVVAAGIAWGRGLWQPQAPSFRGMAMEPPQPAPELRLTDHLGRPFSLASHRGQAVLLYFGYTFCPDACPATMVLFGQVREQLAEQAERVQMVFVTVDPERDTTERLRAYLSHFDPTILGLTGEPDAVAEVLKAYGIFAQKVPVESSATGYLMDHTALVYLVDPEGRLRVMFPFGMGAADMAHDVKQVLAARPARSRSSSR